jgi:hypothetical protein
MLRSPFLRTVRPFVGVALALSLAGCGGKAITLVGDAGMDTNSGGCGPEALSPSLTVTDSVTGKPVCDAVLLASEPKASLSASCPYTVNPALVVVGPSGDGGLVASPSGFSVTVGAPGYEPAVVSGLDMVACDCDQTGCARQIVSVALTPAHDSGSPPVDAGHDGDADGGGDARPDAPADGAQDSPVDAPEDVGSDGPHDAPEDVLRDAPRDAPADVRDAPADVPADVRDAPADVRPDVRDAPADVRPDVRDAPADVPADVRDAPPDVPVDAPPDVGVDAGATPCPPVEPTQSTFCAPSGLDCEYGASTNPDCNALWECVAGKWQDKSVGVVCPPPGATCPSPSSIVPLQSCTDALLMCADGAGTCVCTNSPYGMPMSGGPVWWCLKPGVGCPVPIPQLGTACDADAALVCDYGACSGGVSLSCSGGYWALSNGTACPA